MASPFPGMDPYLEQFWGDIHHSFITYARDQLQPALPGDLRARVEERVFVESPIGHERTMYPDIRVVERGRRGREPIAAPAGVVVAEPIRMRLPDEPVTQGFIEILDMRTGRRVVTVIEVLSHSNKAAGPGRELYERKQRECKQGGVNLVEIDLLRGGRWTILVPEPLVPVSRHTAYRACVYRPGVESPSELYPLPLRPRLPAIKIPLRPTDADVVLDLQALIDQCYRNGGYDEDIDYSLDPDPPLSASDAAWAEGLLREKGRRTPPVPDKVEPASKRRRKRKS